MSQTITVDAKVEAVEQQKVKSGVVGESATSPAKAVPSLDTAKETPSSPSVTGSEERDGEDERGVLDRAVLVEGHSVERTVIGQDTGTRKAVQEEGGPVSTTEVTVDEGMIAQTRRDATSPTEAAASLETAKETRSSPGVTGSEERDGEDEREHPSTMERGVVSPTPSGKCAGPMTESVNQAVQGIVSSVIRVH